MLKTMFEQFVNNGAKLMSSANGLYFYELGETVMCAQVDTTFPYTHKDVEQLIHNDLLKIKRLSFS